MKVYGNAGTGNVIHTTTPDLPRPAAGTRRAHRPWCTDCKRTLDATQLDQHGRCTRCADRHTEAQQRAAIRAAIAEQLATEAKANKGQGKGTTKLPKEGKKGKPTPRPAHRGDQASSTTGTAPEAGPSTTGETPQAAREKRPDAACGPDRTRLDPETHFATRILIDTRHSTDPLVETARATAITALNHLRAIHTTTSTTPSAATRPRPHTSAAGRGKGKPAPAADTPKKKPSTHHGGPQRIELPTAEVIAAYQAGATLAEVATKHGVSAPTIRRCLIDAGITRRRAKAEHTPELVEQVRHLYEDQHLTQAEIGQRLGYSTKVVQNVMTAAGVDRRAAKARHAADNAQGLKQRMADLGLTSADIRAWSRSIGRPMKERGLPSFADIDAYTTAHPQTGAHPA